MSRIGTHAQTWCLGWTLALALVSAPPGLAADGTPPAPASERTIKPIKSADGGSKISFVRCHFQKTPAYEPRTRLECDPGEVVVAVFDDGIRCCELEVR